VAGHHFYSLSPKIPDGYYLERALGFVLPDGSTGLGVKPIYRFYDSDSNDHYYNTVPDVPANYVAEGTEGAVMQLSDPSLLSSDMTLVYRFYNPGSGDHYLNILPDVPAGYQADGTLGYIYRAPQSDRVPLYRFYHDDLAKHFYSLNPTIPDGYHMEDIVCYVVPAQSGGIGFTPIYRFYNGSTGDHYYNVSSAVPAGYVAEGMEGAVVVPTANVIPSGLTILYRFYNPSTGDHYMNIAPDVPAGYQADGQLGYVYASAGADRVPLYQFYEVPPPPDDGGGFLSSAVGFVSGALGYGAGVVTTVVGGAVTAVESTVGIVGDVVGIVVGVIFAIPYVGRVLNLIWNIVLTVVWGVVSIPDFVLTLLGIMFEKRLSLTIFIQNDESGQPVARTEDVLASLQFAIDTFKSIANVRVVPVGLFKFSSPFAGDGKAGSDYLIYDSGSESADTLDCNCDWTGGVEDLGSKGSAFTLKMYTKDTWGNLRRLVGYGAPICAFAVRGFLDGKIGCSEGPLADYVVVKFTNNLRGKVSPTDPQNSTLAHEIGHACNLPHHDVASNLMCPSRPHPAYLTRWQLALFRASRHVTYF
jgi:hypothetical protein